MSVFEFQKLLTVVPVNRSAWLPASAVSVTTTKTTTMTSPVSCDPRNRRAHAEADVVYGGSPGIAGVEFIRSFYSRGLPDATDGAARRAALTPRLPVHARCAA